MTKTRCSKEVFIPESVINRYRQCRNWAVAGGLCHLHQPGYLASRIKAKDDRQAQRRDVAEYQTRVSRWEHQCAALIDQIAHSGGGRITAPPLDTIEQVRNAAKVLLARKPKPINSSA